VRGSERCVGVVWWCGVVCGVVWCVGVGVVCGCVSAADGN
jgi:hypothetical protein